MRKLEASLPNVLTDTLLKFDSCAAFVAGKPSTLFYLKLYYVKSYIGQILL